MSDQTSDKRLSRRALLAGGALVAGVPRSGWPVARTAAPTTRIQVGGTTTTTLLKNTTIVTVDRSLGVLNDCDLLIDGEQIAEMRPGIEAGQAQVLDASDMIVMPPIEWPARTIGASPAYASMTWPRSRPSRETVQSRSGATSERPCPRASQVTRRRSGP